MGRPFVPLKPRPVRWNDGTGPVGFSAADRITSDAWPGVVAWLGDDVRLVVDDRLSYYRVQRRLERDDGSVFWDNAGAGRPALSVGKAVARWLHCVPELAQVAEVLPFSPFDAHPAFAAAVVAQEERWAAVDYRSSVYCRVAAQDGQLRVIVDHKGEVYGVQQVPRDLVEHEGPVWRLLVSSDSAAELVEWLAESTFDDSSARRRGATVAQSARMRARAERLFAGLPQCPVDGSWPSLPEWIGPFPVYELGCRLTFF